MNRNFDYMLFGVVAAAIVWFAYWSFDKVVSHIQTEHDKTMELVCESNEKGTYSCARVPEGSQGG